MRIYSRNWRSCELADLIFAGAGTNCILPTDRKEALCLDVY